VTTPGSGTIDALLDRARKGDRLALDRLFDLCRNYLAMLAQAQVEGWLRAKCDPSDLVQQTLMEAYKGFDGFQGATAGEWLVWLRRILQHNAADYVRRYGAAQKRRAGREVRIGQSGDRSCAPEPADSGASPSEQLLAQERELLLVEALARLSPDHRDVISLRNLQGLPFDAIAQRMGRSRPAVQMLWIRAVENLQRLVREQLSSSA
jgi:RNA polymerase sigma-70 factor (ECF subfamily)